MKTLNLLLILGTNLLATISIAQEYILKGSVQDVHSQPIHQAEVVNLGNPTERTLTDSNGLFVLTAQSAIARIQISKGAYATETLKVGAKTFVATKLKHAPIMEGEVQELVTEDLMYESAPLAMDVVSAGYSRRANKSMGGGFIAPQENWNTESYSAINENGFKVVVDDPLSTFSIDVDRASYSNVRRFINNGQMPPIDAVRVEEMINYFNYEYASPDGDDPVKIFTEVADAPWNKDHKLLHVGVKARELDKKNLPPSNMVFLIDVSGSMSNANKLPLLKSAMKMLVQELRPQDRVAIVVYAGAAGLVLESTPGNKKEEINAAIDRLQSGGSTAGGAGIKLAYNVAAKNFNSEGNNRVILATDGDFNIGASSDGEMQRLIENKRETGVFLTVLGFGMGNYKDSKMEVLADKGNGNYAYIDNITEAKKTLVNEFGSTLFAVAKDVKIQIEFNPANVAEYRLIGYENRLLNKEDFNDDMKDAGEMGVGHVVTALYEVIPVGKGSKSKVDPLRYSPSVMPTPFKEMGHEIATLKLRYKEPEGEKSKLMTQVIPNKIVPLNEANINLQWSASVAGFGMLLRKSKYAGDLTYSSVVEQAKGALGNDKEGYRREALQLMKSAELMSKSTASR
ncbi:MAG: DUF3520 domain-containing protein [Flavobacteriales bacterium]|jgi:Ca-activated chloride channel homolog|nr:DUF3520 domain-containing protein [Flavobacteriales bacterium]MBT3964262.1 DUF3520 domain-containing protein [Flavobacteriales bacterium]MBT4705091.1 DUF3520 domain-containing protein [Flavobacteriales bacterium]MBT4930111.1 DUF3520 domain-containing protein [Flavobacteriales bacterium]MBT5133069.1 DUF3520 domain-containing protein [Flavobacteriales bacterium]